MESDRISTRSAKGVKPLRSKVDFETLVTNGNQLRPSSWLILRWKKNTVQYVRLGCSIPRYVGNAVIRNRLRRWLREGVRQTLQKTADYQAVDLHFVFRRQGEDFYRNLEHVEFDRILAKGIGKTLAKN